MLSLSLLEAFAWVPSLAAAAAGLPFPEGRRGRRRRGRRRGEEEREEEEAATHHAVGEDRGGETEGGREEALEVDKA